MLRALGRTFSRRRNAPVETSYSAADGEQGLPTGDDQLDNALDSGSPTSGLQQGNIDSSALSSPDGVIHLGSVSQAVLDQKLDRLRSYRISFQVDRYAESEAGESVVSDASRAFKPSPVKEHPGEGTDVTVIKSPADAALRKVKVAFQNAAGSTTVPALAAFSPAANGHASTNGHAPVPAPIPNVPQPAETTAYSTPMAAAASTQEVIIAGNASAEPDLKPAALPESHAAGRDSSTTPSDDPAVFSGGELLDSVSDVELSVESGLYVGSTRPESVTSQADADLAALGLPPGLWNRKARSAPPLLCANALFEEEELSVPDVPESDMPLPALSTAEVEIPHLSTNPAITELTRTPTMLSTMEVEPPSSPTNPALNTAPTMMSTTEVEFPPVSPNPAAADLTTAPTMPYEPAETSSALPEPEEPAATSAFPELLAVLPNISSPRTNPSAEFISFNDLAHNSDIAAAGATTTTTTTELQGDSAFKGFTDVPAVEARSNTAPVVAAVTSAPVVAAVQEHAAAAAAAALVPAQTAGESFVTAVEAIAAEPAAAEDANEDILIEEDHVPTPAFRDDESITDVIGLSPIPEGNSRDTTFSEAVPVLTQQPADISSAVQTAKKEANNANDLDSMVPATVLLDGAPSNVGITTASSAEMSVTVISPVTATGEGAGASEPTQAAPPVVNTTERMPAVIDQNPTATPDNIISASKGPSSAPQARKLEPGQDCAITISKEAVVKSAKDASETVATSAKDAQQAVVNGAAATLSSKVGQANTEMKKREKRKSGLLACFCGSA